MGKPARANVACIGQGETLREAGHRLRESGVAALAVRGEDGHFRGVITAGKVVEAIAAGADPKTVTVAEAASCAPAFFRLARQPGLHRVAGEVLQRRDMPVTGDYRATRRAAGPCPGRHKTEQRIGELVSAVRAAAAAVSRFSAATTAP